MFDPKNLFDDAVQTQILDMMIEASSIAHDMQNMVHMDGFVAKKDDNTTVTKADIAVENFIQEKLKTISPDVFFLGEEEAKDIAQRDEEMPDQFWLCDPIDGTMGYAKGQADYAITLALILKGRPVYGLISLPHYREILYTATPEIVMFFDTHLNEKTQMKKMDEDQGGGRLIIGPGRINAKDIYRKLFNKEPKDVIERASALKFVELVKGQADVYIRERQLCEWDVAAGDIIIHIFGGSMINYTTKDVVKYGQKDKNFRVEEIMARA